jgi:predicted  nucleic acid-binding Zn-ribbon protein
MPQEMKNMIARRDKINKNSVEAADKVKSVELAIRKSESEAGRLEEENARLLQQSSKVKKQAEYDAMLLAIDNNKNKIAAEEENTLLYYDMLETAKDNYRKVKKDNDDEIKIIKSEFDEIIAFSKKVEAEIAKAKAARPALVNAVSPDIYSNYTRLFNGKNGTPPVCAVENGICGGCHLRITPQTLNDIARDKMAVCDNCQCYVYIPEE